MTATRETPSLADYWAVVRRRRKLVAGCTIVAVFLAALWTWWSGPQYESQASVVIRPILTGPFDQSRIDDVGAGTEAKVLDSTVVAELAAKKLHRSPADAPLLLQHLTVDNPIGTLILNITYAAATPDDARRGAQAFADAYLSNRQHTADGVKARAMQRLQSQRSELDRELNDALTTIAASPAGSDARTTAESRRDVLLTQITQLQSSSSALASVDTSPGQLIRPANLPSGRSGPSPALTFAGAAVLGALLGAGLGFVKERRDPRVRSRQVLTDAIGTDPLAELAPLSSAKPLPAATDPVGVAASAFRRLRVSVWPRRGTGPHRVLITTPTNAATSDTVANNLAITAARGGWSTLLAWTAPAGDGGLLNDEYDESEDTDDTPLEKLLLRTPDYEGLAVLPALTPADQHVAPDVVSERLGELEGEFDIELLVGAPVLGSPEAFELCPLVDGTLLVFDVARDTRADLERCIDALSSTGTPVLGVVAVSVPVGW
ncbi:MAG: hypothetical protein ACXV8T_11365 [Acidimicrobiia bacterium]